jgi:hypothetical protein
MQITLRVHTLKTTGQERVFKTVGFYQTKNIVFSLDIYMALLTRARFFKTKTYYAYLLTKNLFIYETKIFIKTMYRGYDVPNTSWFHGTNN